MGNGDDNSVRIGFGVNVGGGVNCFGAGGGLTDGVKTKEGIKTKSSPLSKFASVGSDFKKSFKISWPFKKPKITKPARTATIAVPVQCFKPSLKSAFINEY